MPNNQILYKYRSLKDFKFFMDILINNRLYAAKYNELNDIREGFYRHDGSLKKITIADIRNIKEETRICSTTKNMKSQLMWTHYADNHTGIAIGFKNKDENSRCELVKYDGIKKDITHEDSLNIQSLTDDILLHKEKDWKYEKEIRIFKNEYNINQQTFINIEIVEVILGKRMAENDVQLLKKLINSFNPKIKIKTIDRKININKVENEIQQTR